MISIPEPIAHSHELRRFLCGKPALDDWLKQRALSDHEKGFTSVIVVHELQRVVGYYGLAPTAIAPTTLPRNVRTGQPPDPVPCLLLGQLAVDLEWTGRSLGSGLLKHALSRSAQAARLIGGRALLVKAVDDSTAAYWLRQDFRPTKNDPMMLYRPMADVAASVAEGASPGRDGG